MKSLQLAIVVAGYNRPNSLKRILGSLARAEYPKDKKISLIISIDKSDNPEVAKVAEEFVWAFGGKDLILHEKNLGLRQHILSCGDLVQKYENIILLEDDLYVSRYFYFYAEESLERLGEDERIAGISLYSQAYNESSFMGFVPHKDGFDNYFMQIPSSWGQCWSKRQWEKFRSWYETRMQSAQGEAYERLPSNVHLWPETSWKKYYYEYMIEKDLYFSYPYQSFSTNFADVGTHHFDGRTTLQVPLSFYAKKMNLSTLDQSKAVYDSHCEMTPECLKKWCADLRDINFDIDMYGRKKKKNLLNEFVITSKTITGKPVRSFGRALKPQEVNIIEMLEGDIFHLARVEDVEDVSGDNIHDTSKNSYYYNIPKMFLHRLVEQDSATHEANLVKDYNEYKLLKQRLSFKLYQKIFRD